MSSEAALRQMAKEKLGPFGKLERLEQKMGEGTPDLLWVLCLPGYPAATGLMELKHLSAFPMLPDSPCTIPTLTRAQANWARDWETAHGTSPLLLQVGSTYCLFAGWQVGQLFLDNHHTKAQLLAAAVVVGNGEFPTAAILKALVRKENYPPLQR